MSKTLAPAGRYPIKLGDSFLSPQNDVQFYTFHFNSKVDASLKSRQGSVKEEGETLVAEWPASEGYNELTYEGVPLSNNELDYLLVFDEQTNTFTLERQSQIVTLKKSRKRKAPAVGKRRGAAGPAQPRSEKTRKSSTRSSSSRRSSVAHPDPVAGAESAIDDFDFDLSKDMDEILGNDDDDEDDDDGDSNTFEEITPTATQYTTPSVSNTPPSILAPKPSTPSSQKPQGKHRRIKLASAPIRLPSPSGPSPTPTARKTTKPSVATNNAPSSPSGSSGSLSSGSSSSGSSESGSSSASESESSDSDSGDDPDMDDLEKSILLTMSSDNPPAPATPGTASKTPKRVPTQQPSPVVPSPQTQRSNGSGPMSLRALYKDGDDEEEEDDGSGSSSGSEIA